MCGVDDIADAVIMRRPLKTNLFRDTRLIAVKKGKVFPYSLPSVGPGADPGVQAVSPQVT